MKNIEINQIVKDLKSLLGKQVSYSISLAGVLYETDGQVTSIVFNLNDDHEFSLDDSGCFTSFSELVEFKILDAT